MRSYLCIIGTIAALSAAPAAAAEFADWDADDNSFVDRAEFDTGIGSANAFESFDADADMGLNAEEIAGVRYATMDADGDGTVALAEWDSWVDRRIGEGAVNLSAADWDENGDGVISRVEFDEEVARRGRFTPFEAGEEEAYDEEEFRTGLFEDLDVDEDERLGEDELLIDNLGM